MSERRERSRPATRSLTPPLPRRTRDSAPYWDACGEHRLILPRCRACGTHRYPPLPGCPECGSPEAVWVEVSPTGTVIRGTVVHARAHPAFEPPYALVVVRLDCGAKVLSRLVGPPEAAVHGARVDGVWQDLPEAETALLLFAPAS